MEVTRASQTWPQGDVPTKTNTVEPDACVYPSPFSSLKPIVTCLRVLGPQVDRAGRVLAELPGQAPVPTTPVTGTRGRGNRKHGRSLPQAQQGAHAGEPEIAWTRTARAHRRAIRRRRCLAAAPRPQAGWEGRVQLWQLRGRLMAASAPNGTLWTPARGTERIADPVCY